MEEARTICQDQNADLALITSKDEIEMVKRILLKEANDRQAFWIGLQKVRHFAMNLFRFLNINFLCVAIINDFSLFLTELRIVKTYCPTKTYTFPLILSCIYIITNLSSMSILKRDGATVSVIKVLC